MKYIPSIAFEEMSGSAKGVTAAKMKSRKYIRNRGYGGSVRTSDQAKVKGIFKQLTTQWKSLSSAQILAWNKLALSQEGRSVLGTKAKISGSNLFTRLNYWIVACGGNALTMPPTLVGVETPSEATVVCSGNVFTFKLNEDLSDNGGIFLVIEATEGQSNGVSRAHAKAVAIKMVEEPSDAVIDIAADYVAKHGALNAGAPKVFLRYYFVNSSTGEKSGVMLAECKWVSDGSEAAAPTGDNSGSSNGGTNSGQSTNQGGSQSSGSDNGSSQSGNTSGSEQGGSQSGTVAAPVITSMIDEMSGPEVTITGPQGADLYYTKNGDTPTAESSHYTSQFTVAAGTTIKAIAILNGVSSEVTTYVVPSDNEPLNPDDH